MDMFKKHFGSFGRRTLKREIKKKHNVNISEYKISKILKANGKSPKYGRKKGTNVHTNKDVSEKYIAENIFNQLKKADKIKDKKIWSTDFTEIKINGKKIFICGIISVNSKILVGLKISYKNNSQAATETLKTAIEKFGTPDIIMSDRGSPFVSRSFKELLESNNIKHSMSRPYTPADNAYIETYWKSMKIEIGSTKHLSEAEVRAIILYYEHYYNFERPHSTLGYCTPMERLYYQQKNRHM